MKKFSIALLSFLLLLTTGCGKNNTAVINKKILTSIEAAVIHVKIPFPSENILAVVSASAIRLPEPAAENSPTSSEQAEEKNPVAGVKTEENTQETTQVQTSRPPQSEEEPSRSEPAPEPSAPADPTVVSYDPNQVCSLAVRKCQAGGMITTIDNLKKNLAEGKITQEEYNAYYPYDGLGFYSVFVETNLNTASTTSGQRLGSVEEIANYIANMMLLETESIFYIEYHGIYSLNGTDFYEFRCYR